MAERRKRGRAPLVLAGCVFVLGLGLLLWRPVSNWVTQQEMDQVIESLPTAGKTTAPADEDPADDEASNEATDAVLERFEAYNQSVRDGCAGAVNDPFTSEEESDLLGDVSSDGLIGSLSIPAMDCTLPLYLGATDEHMAQGAAVVSGTSLPLGQSDSNCVVAAHRGWTTAAMFRDIEQLSLGDDVYVTNYWQTLHYRVVEIAVVDPSDTQACAVQPSRDLLTLLTCHPYGVHPSPSRMLVYCERVDDEEEDALGADGGADEEADEGEGAAEAEPVASEDSAAGKNEGGDTEAVAGSPLLRLEHGLFVAGCAIALAFGAWLFASLLRARHEHKQTRGRHRKV